MAYVLGVCDMVTVVERSLAGSLAIVWLEPKWIRQHTFLYTVLVLYVYIYTVYISIYICCTVLYCVVFVL